jgi:hypothetical protein
MRLSPAATAGVLLSLALILSACGEDRTAAADKATSAGTAEAKAPAAAGKGCAGELHGLLGSMDTLRRKLAAGLSYDQYLREVRALRVVYDGIHADRVGLDCLLTTGAPAERALNRYIAAANTWGDCLATVSCSTESVEPKLQRRWALASDLLSSAQRGLREAAPS